MIETNVGRLPTIWMNVTTSATWTRPAVGIVRVEQEICRELERFYGSRFQKCIFENGEFVPHGSSDSFSAPKGLVWPDSSRIFPRTSSFDTVFGNRKRFSSSGSDSRASNILIASEQKDAVSHDFMKHGDVLISLGLDWDYPYLDKFYELKKSLGIRVISCCYDLIPILYPQYCVGHVAAGFKEYFGKLSWSSSTMLCISQQSRSDYRKLVRQIGAPEIPSVVIPLGDNVPDAKGIVGPEIQRLKEKPYILFVSTIERRKNHEVLYRAYHLLAKDGHGKNLPKLVFVGMPGWGVGDLLKDIELDPLIEGRIVQLNHVTDAELSFLYRNAKFMVYPSLYEGWGLPVGEALACGKAVVASARGSIPEVGGDLVVYVDPWNAQAWADEILRLVEHPEQLEALENAISSGYKPRVWADTAKAVMAAVDALGPAPRCSLDLLPGYDMRTLVGAPCAGAMRSLGQKGVLTFGPYWPLSPGKYDIEIDVVKIGGAAGDLSVRVCHQQGTKEIAASRLSFDRGELFDGAISLSINIKERLKDFEIVTEITEGLLVSINAIRVVELEDKAQGISSSDRQYA